MFRRRRLIKKCLNKALQDSGIGSETLVVYKVDKNSIVIQESRSITEIVLALIASGSVAWEPLITALNREELSEFLTHGHPDVRRLARGRMKVLEARNSKWLFKTCYFLKHLSFYKRPRFWGILSILFAFFTAAGFVAWMVTECELLVPWSGVSLILCAVSLLALLAAEIIRG